MTRNTIKLSSAEAKMKAIATSAISAVTKNSTSSSLYNAGANTIQGYINGVSSKSSALYSKLRSIASSAISTFKSVLGIASPSKVFKELAGYTAEGYVNGIENQQANVSEAMEGMATAALSAFKDTMDYSYGSDGLADAYIASSTVPADLSNYGQTMLRLELPIYLKDGTYTKTEIVEIALAGVSRLQSARSAVKGAFA